MKREDCPRKRKSWQCSEESAWVLLWHRAQDHADFGEAHEGNDKMSERKARNAWVRPAELMGRAVPPVTRMFPQPHTVLRIQRWKKYPISVVEQKIPRQRIWTCSVLLEGLCGLKLSLGNRHILGCDGPGLTRSCRAGPLVAPANLVENICCHLAKLRMGIIKGGEGLWVSFWPHPWIQELRPGILQDLNYIWETDPFHGEDYFGLMISIFCQTWLKHNSVLGQWVCLVIHNLARNGHREDSKRTMVAEMS